MTNHTAPQPAPLPWWRRYDDARAEAHLDFTAKNAHRFPKLRNRRAIRRLVILRLVFLALGLVSAGIAYFSTPWFFGPFIVSLVGIVACQIVTAVVTGGVADTPAIALDEYQQQQRLSARSMAFTVVTTVMFLPYAILIALALQDAVNPQHAYGTAILIIELLLVSTSIPSMLTAWWSPEGELDDEVPAHPGTGDSHA